MLTLHEMVIDGDNAWVTVNKNIPKDLSKYGGAYNGALVDSAVQEYNLTTGKLLYTWDALDHIPLNDSHASLPTNGVPLGRLPRQLDPARRPGQVPRLDAQHVGRVPRRHHHGQDRVDARRQALELQVRPARGLRVAARRDAASRLDDLDVRRPLLPAHRRRHLRRPDRAVARARAQARPAGTHRDARRRVHAREQLRRRLHGQHAAAGRRRRVRRLGFATVLLRCSTSRAR